MGDPRLHDDPPAWRREASGPPTPRVLLIPGLDGDPGLLLGAAPRLFPGRRFVAFPHAHDSIEAGVEGLADRALALLDVEGLASEQVDVCAESFGGIVALTLARRRPERVRSLILLSTFGWYPALATLAGRLGLAFWSVAGDRVAARVMRLWRWLGAPAALGLRCAPEIRRAYLKQPAVPLAGYRAKCSIALDFDARPWLHQVRCPCFVLAGVLDLVVPAAASRELARRLPDARLHILVGGHLVHIVRSNEVGALIGEWTRDRFADVPTRVVL